MSPAFPVWPDYHGNGLANVPALVAQLLGAPTDGLCPPLTAAVLETVIQGDMETVVLLLVDGLGNEQLLRAIAEDRAPTFARLLDQARSLQPGVGYSVITSVFPSSTVPALATLATGLPPARHGLLGWTLHLPELDGPTETVRWGPAASQGSYADAEHGGHDPVQFLGEETIHERLARAGVASYVVAPAEHKGSPFSRMLYHGAIYAPHRGLADIFREVEELRGAHPRGQRLAIYAYWPDLDAAAHWSGPASPRHSDTLAELDAALGRWLQEALRHGKTLFLLTADHGHVTSDPTRAVIFTHHPELLDLLEAPPTGERRVAYIHPRPGCLAQARDYVESCLAEMARVLTPEEAFARGLFGPGPARSEALQRVGDLVLLPRTSDVQFHHPYLDAAAPVIFAGNHGGLEPEEMNVPLLAVRL